MANMVEGGKTPLLPAAELEALGFALVIFPGGIVRALAKAARGFLRLARGPRHHRAVPRPHVRFRALNDLIGTPELLALGKRYDEKNRSRAARRAAINRQ